MVAELFAGLGAVKAAFWAPEGCLDGWPRCKTMSHEEMAGTSSCGEGTFLFCSKGHFCFAATQTHRTPSDGKKDVTLQCSGEAGAGRSRSW